MSNLDPKVIVYGLSVIAAGIAAAAGVFAGVGITKTTSNAVEAVARQPEAKSSILTTLIVGCAFAEATAIYGLLVAILLILVKIM